MPTKSPTPIVFNSKAHPLLFQLFFPPGSGLLVVGCVSLVVSSWAVALCVCPSVLHWDDGGAAAEPGC